MNDVAHANTGTLVSWAAVNWTRSRSRNGEPTTSSITELFGRGAEQWYAARAINPQRAARILAGRLVVRDLVAERGKGRWAGFEPTTQGRKPVITDSDVDFSITHSAQWLVAAIVEAGQVGVDVETHTSEFDHPGLMRRMCTADELEQAWMLDPAIRRGWLARLWTAKEAVSKLDGCGLRSDFRLMQLGDRIPVGDAEHPLVASIAVRQPDNARRGGERVFTLLHPRIAPGSASAAEVMT
jgi:phosphopantetheinyl transferase